MLKKFSYFIILALFLFIQSISSSLAFHKHDSDILTITLDDSEGLNIKYLKESYCTSSVQKIIETVEEKPKAEGSIVKKKIETENNEKKELTKFIVEQPHSKEPKIAPEKLNFLYAKKIKINELGLLISDKTTVEQLLRFYCLQPLPKESKKAKYKINSNINTLYDEIAKINGLVDRDSPIGPDIYNKGEIYLQIKDSEDEIKKLLYSEARFITDEIKKIKIKEDKAADAQKKKDEKKARDNARKDAIKKGNEKWISENKQKYLDQFKQKKSEYLKIIRSLEDDRNNLNNYLKELKIKFDEADEEIEIAFDDLANINAEIKNKKKEIRENKKIFLSKVIIESIDKELKRINKINFEKYGNYVKLNKIIKKADSSNSAKAFVGKEGFEVKLPKLLGGKTFFEPGKKLGLIEQFEDIKDKSLGSGYKSDSSSIKELEKEIKKAEYDINEFILSPVNELIAYDNALEEEKAKIPLLKYAIYLVIFLALVAGILYLILYLRKAKEDLEEKAEKKVGSLKSDLEGKIKHTSEQIRSVRTSSSRQSQSQTEAQPSVKEEPKTPEQIIADKYDELISDYNDALDDFSKVAGFKQKWNGLALSRKERQEGTKTVLISSSRAFEKAEIWCVTFSDKYFAFPGSTVKSNMATYMNLDFEKASRDFKGVFSVSSGSSYVAEPSVLRKGGAGFVVERSGKIVFPN